MTFRADLHCHSTYSDGTDTPQELIEQAIELQLGGLSITDHDTVAAYPEALSFAKEKQFPLLVGIEFSASHYGTPVHILGYAFQLKSEAIDALCKRHQERRRQRNRNILQKLQQLGISIDESELGEEGHTLGRPHIAKEMIKRGVVSTIKEAFECYLGEGKKAYDPGEPISVLETIETIHQAGGKALIAHPHLINRSSVERQLLQMPFDGVEGYYARFAPHQERKWIQIAQEKGWLVSGGSDYHGRNKPFNLLGSSWVGRETFEQLYAQSTTSKS
ncbi:MAG: 5'-3' exoribonuclease [Chlamydiales bacterium]|nr:5'-3' exoribonuclease [Chlamydiales bacterium]